MDKWITAGVMAVTHLPTAPTTTTAAADRFSPKGASAAAVSTTRSPAGLSPPMMKWARFR